MQVRGIKEIGHDLEVNDDKIKKTKKKAGEQKKERKALREEAKNYRDEKLQLGGAEGDILDEIHDTFWDTHRAHLEKKHPGQAERRTQQAVSNYANYQMRVIFDKKKDKTLNKWVKWTPKTAELPGLAELGGAEGNNVLAAPDLKRARKEVTPIQIPALTQQTHML